MMRRWSAGVLCAASVGAVAQVPPAAPGRTASPLRLASDPQFRYHLHVPPDVASDAPILVSVHGISRNAKEHLRRFAPLADAAGVVLLVPEFPARRFPHYQQLRPDEAGQRPDRLLISAVDEVAATLGMDGSRVHLFGYSGGAQFVHRFTMRHPQRVRSYTAGAAGWYTLPDPAQRYPYGLAYSRRLRLGGFEPEAFLRVPGLVLVGERDAAVGTALRRSGRVSEAQGVTRLARAQRWVESMNATAADLGLPPAVRYEELPRSPHSFGRSMRRGAMGERVVAHVLAHTDGWELARPAGIEPAPQPSEGWMISTSPRSPSLGF